MDFLKKHYEKLVLGLVLVGLALAVAWLPFKISSDKQSMEDQRNMLINPKVRQLTNLDLTISEAALKRMATPATIDFSEPNKVFNPMPWQKTPPPEERLIPATKVGPASATVTNLAPLYLRLSLDSVTVSDSGPRYVIGVQKEAALNARDRSKKQTYSTLHSKNDLFAVVEVKGKPEEPTQLILQLNDSGERVAISKEKPFERIEGWTADVRYEPERKSWANRRVGAQLAFAGEDYNIVAINRDEVVLSAKSNGKKWTIKTNPSAAP
ncbi:MAG TPA: hypothetical protein VN673_05745 [Clostridia bacterium]|nr:hypothetical protein [Clostridia bacterium]